MDALLLNPIDALRLHWPEYLIEATLLGIFMVVACSVVVAVQHPDSPIGVSIRKPLSRRILIGFLMGLTAVGLIYSPLGQRSGAHMNPGTTLTFYLLGKVKAWDAVWYVVAQIAGACIGVAVCGLLWRGRMAHPSVNYAATVPGPNGLRVAWIGEFVIGFIMMIVVLISSNHGITAPYTGMMAGALVVAFIVFEAPFSGMSLNPARSLGSAIPARAVRVLWIYFTAPPIGMLCAAGVYTSMSGTNSVYCAKLNHRGHEHCIFNCHIDQIPKRIQSASSSNRQQIK